MDMRMYCFLVVTLFFGASLARNVKRQAIEEGAEVSPGERDDNSGGEQRTAAQTALSSFWTQLVGALGVGSQDFITKLAQNKGDLGKTLKQFQASLGDTYGQLLPLYNQFKPIWTGVVGTFGDSPMTQNALKWFKGKLQSLTEGSALSGLFASILRPAEPQKTTQPQFILPSDDNTEGPEAIADVVVSD